MSRVAEGSIIKYCSVCYGQYPERVHIDFEAAYDGPVIDEANGMKHPIDDLVVCDECLIGAAMLLGWVNAEDLKDENLELGFLIRDKDKIIEEQAKVISNLEHTVDTMLDTPMKRGTGRPKVILPEDTVRA